MSSQAVQLGEVRTKTYSGSPKYRLAFFRRVWRQGRYQYCDNEIILTET
jgi:hypothetical protein